MSETKVIYLQQGGLTEQAAIDAFHRAFGAEQEVLGPICCERFLGNKMWIASALVEVTRRKYEAIGRERSARGELAAQAWESLP